MDKKFARFLLAALLAAVILLAPMSASAAATVTSAKTETQISLTLFVPCANGGAGEYVAITGTMTSTFRLVFDGAGGYHQSERYSYKGEGIGQSTGEAYRFSGEDNYKYKGKLGELTTYVWNWQVAGQGTSFMMRGNYHTIVHPDGTVTGYHDEITADCK